MQKIDKPSKLPYPVQRNIADAVKKEKHELSPILYYEDWKRYYSDFVFLDTKNLNTPKLAKIQQLFEHHIGLLFNSEQLDDYPYSNIDDIVSVRGDIAHNVFAEEYLKRVKLIEYYDSLTAVVKDIDKKLYNFLPSIINKKPWKDTY